MKPEIKKLGDTDPREFDGWIFKGLIGEGGFSTIYLAEKNGQVAALKLIRKDYLYDEDAVNRFFTEIKNLEILDHPNIAKFIESKTDLGVPYFAVEYIPGTDLETFVRNKGPIVGDEWLRLALELAKALEYCHSRKIIHKDVSPGNIVLGPTGPVFIDFGLSYLEQDPRLTSIEVAVGTSPYMSPEHINHSDKLFREMDIFSLAGTLIFAATGHFPFNGSNKSEWFDSILYEKPNFDGLSAEQVNLIKPLLYKDPSLRLPLSILIKQLESLANRTDLDSQTVEILDDYSSKSTQKLTTGRGSGHSTRGTKLVRKLAISSLTAATVVAGGVLLIENMPAGNNSNSITEIKKSASPTPATVNSVDSSESIQASSTPTSSVSRKSTGESSTKIKEYLAKAETYYYENKLEDAKKFALLAANSGNAQGMYRYGYILNQQGDTEGALVWMKKAANLNFADAYLGLGNIYEKLGNETEKVKWWSKGAAQGNTSSMWNLALYYEDINQRDQAEKLYLKAAALGHVNSMFNLGYLYDDKKQTGKAFEWYAKALNGGQIMAAVNMAIMYEDMSDWTNAKRYYEIAAKAGNVDGMYGLAYHLQNHSGNIVEACIWYKKAAEKGDNQSSAALSKYCSNQ